MKPTIQALKNKTSHDAPREFGGTLGETCVLCSLSKVFGFSPKIIGMNDYGLFSYDEFILFYLLPPPLLIWPVPTSQVPCSFPPYFPWRSCSWSLWVGPPRPVCSAGPLLYPQLSSCGTLWPLRCCWAGSVCISSSISCHLERYDACSVRVGGIVEDRMFPPLFKLWCHWWTVCVYLQVSEGLVLRDGTRLKYPINGIVVSCFMVVFCQTLHVSLSHVWNLPVYCLCHPEPQSSGLQQLKTLFTAARGRLLSSVS